MAAVFATAVVNIIPTVNFAGLIVPVSSLNTTGRLVGQAFPGAWYQQVSAGSFVKGYGWHDMSFNALVLAGFAVGYIALAVLLLRKQEA